MLDNHLDIVESTLKEAEKRKGTPQLASMMFDRFFEQHPEATAFFEDLDMKDVRRIKYWRVAEALVDVLKFPDYSESSLSEEVYRHRWVHEVRDREYYFAMAEALVDTLRQVLGEDWTARHEECWRDTLGGLKHGLASAAQEHLGT